MIEINKDLIKEINNKCPNNQGIFNEQNGIPDNVKGLVVYSRYTNSGQFGGDCWGSEPQHFESSEKKDKLKVLDIILTKVMPNILYSQFKLIDELIETNSDTEYEYYGNYNNYTIEYIKLDKLIKLLNEIEQGKK